MSSFADLDLTEVNSCLKDLENLLSCHLCGKVPSDKEGSGGKPVVKLISTCGHSLCALDPGCNSFGGGDCPVPGCGLPCRNRDIVADTANSGRIADVVAIRRIIFTAKGSSKDLQADAAGKENASTGNGSESGASSSGLALKTSDSVGSVASSVATEPEWRKAFSKR